MEDLTGLIHTEPIAAVSVWNQVDRRTLHFLCDGNSNAGCVGIDG